MTTRGEDAGFAPGLRARAGVVDRAARQLVNKTPGLWASRDHDEVVSLLNEVLWEIWREAGGAWPDGYERQLYLRGRSAVRHWADRSAGLGGVTGASEKRRQLRSAMHAEADWLAGHGGRPAEPGEMAAWWQGFGGTMNEQDALAVGGTVALGDASGTIPSAERGPAEQAVERADVEATVSALVALAEAHSPALGRFARAWLTAVVEGRECSITEVARASGTPRSSATRYVAAVRAAASEQLEEAVAALRLQKGRRGK